MSKTQVIFAVLIVNLCVKNSGAQSLDTIDSRMVMELAKRIGDELWNVGGLITKRSEVQESFSQAKIVNKSGMVLVEKIAQDLEAMLNVRINAVKRIVKEAEKLPKVENMTYLENFNFTNTRPRDEFRKEILRLDAIRNEELEKASQDPNYTKTKKPVMDSPICYKSNNHKSDEDSGTGCAAQFNEALNLKSREASVFLPLDIFDKDINVNRSIYRTKGLDKVFLENYQKDPTIGWQYFCNSTGTFRHYPATEWQFEPINSYDCRMRHWFTAAAASPKDIMILIESSGSMNGTRIIVAKDVVRNILDMLTPNDFVNIIQFNDTSEYMINCSRGLIQATSPNIYELKNSLSEIITKGQTDLAEALTESFIVLEKHKNTSANCNQMIMLITDGMEYNTTIQAIFEEYNRVRGNNVRVFSFLIGDQIPEGDYEQVKLMACENRGYYCQIDTLEETREQAMKFIPILARPLAHSNLNPLVWSNIYVDIIEPFRITNHDWNCKQNEVQRIRMVKYLQEYDWYPCITMNEPEAPNADLRKYVFMTTVSMPAYDRGANASLMGVAAIDVPLFEFERLFQNFVTGVGGYTFVIDQNGNILTHPDFRPFFQGTILKPSYQSVDIAEVELMDDGSDPRNFSSNLHKFRESIIDRNAGSKFMFARQPYDDMRRTFRLKRNYFWKKIAETPFTVVTTFPEHFTGRVQIPENIDGLMTKGSNLAQFFKDDFKIHPDWIYCRGIRKGFEDMKLGEIDPDNCEMTPEEELVFYLEKYEEDGWKWKGDKLDSNETLCDRKLMQLLIFDAKVTQNFQSDFTKRLKEIIEKFDIKTSFISTHSGLLRYKIFDMNVPGEEFGNKMKNSIDEVWYKHAVEYNKDNPQSFVYSVPFNAYEQDDPLITSTHSIFVRDGAAKVPIAVVGYQFAHSKLKNIVQQLCPRDKEEQCYILDDNAYILFDPDAEHTGKFFGSIEKKLMQILIEDKIYERVKVYDYQGVCYQDKYITYGGVMNQIGRNSALTVLIWNPFKYIAAFFATLLSTVYTFPSHMANLMYPDQEHFYDEKDYESFYCPNVHEKEFMECLSNNSVTTNDTTNSMYESCLKKKKTRYQKCMEEKGPQLAYKRHVARTRPIKCDKFNEVYSLTKELSNFNKPYDECSRPFIVQQIAHSNLILLVTNRICSQDFEIERIFNDVPQTIEYFNSSMFCFKISKPFFRKGPNPKGCLFHHADEPNFDPKNNDRSQCGRGHKLTLNNFIRFLLLLTLLKVFVAT